MTKEQMLVTIEAIKAGRLDYIAELLNDNTDWLLTSLEDDRSNGLLAIHHASLHGQLELVKMLLNKNPGLLNITDGYGQTPVLWAAAMNHEALVDYLSTMGADLTIAANIPGRESHGYQPLYWATRRGHHNVVQCLINHGADINIRLDGYHLIHTASMAGHLEVVKVLLNKAPDLLNIVDRYNQTPVLLAAANGHAPVVAYLISENANLDITTNRANHRDHGKTPLTIAMENKYYDVVNLLILKKAANQSQETILPFVQTGEQALELMILKPELISMLMQNNRVVRLITATNIKITGTSINWYKPAGRRPSLFAHIDTANRTSSVFTPAGELGRGGYGIVRLFQTADGQKIGVKSLKNDAVNISRDQREYLAKELKREAEFNQRAYPEDNFSRTFQFNYRKDDRQIYTNRYVMPYIQGKTAWSFIPSITCPRQLAEITLRIVEELQRIHNLGIIHGDLNPSNIMIYCDENKTFMVRLIDFGCSSYLTDRSVTLWRSSARRKAIAPELCSNQARAVKPHTNQDVYTLGYSLEIVFTKTPSYPELKHLFPSISAFILASQNINPMARPPLEAFRNQLRNELNPTIETDALPINTSQIENNTPRAEPALITNPLWVSPPERRRLPPNEDPTPKTNGCCCITM